LEDVIRELNDTPPGILALIIGLIALLITWRMMGYFMPRRGGKSTSPELSLEILKMMIEEIQATRLANQEAEARQQERFEQTIKTLEARMGEIQKEDKTALDPLLNAIPAKTEERLLLHFDAIPGKVSTVVQSQLDLQAINLAALRTDLTDKLQEAMAILKQIEGGFEAALQRELAEINQKLDDLATTIRINGFGNELLPPTPPLIALKTLPDAAVPQTPETPTDASAQAETMTEEK